MSEEKRIRQKLKNDFAHYASKCLKIRPKDGQIYPLILNKAQLHIHQIVEQQKRETGKIRAIILKGRQQGCSTYIEARFYWLVTHHFGLRAFILTHSAEATQNLFEMAARYHQHCPQVVRPDIQASNAKELLFSEIDSGYKIGTAGNKNVGRSSTIQLLHGSEVAFWDNAPEHAKGILQAVPDSSGTEIFIESTANGLGTYFHQQWQMAEIGESEYLPIFIPWYWQEEYRKAVPEDFRNDDLNEEEHELIRMFDLDLGQILWRRTKIKENAVGGSDGKKAFMQEYPCTSSEAFQTTGDDSYISPPIVMSARKASAEKYGPLIVGVDPARFGDDHTSIIRRRGRVAYRLESFSKHDTMEIVGIIHRIILSEEPAKVCVDIGGLGAGVYDRLKELGFSDIVIGINSGSSPLNAKRYLNKRAEMWGEMSDWLVDIPVQIPDNDALHADLCSVKYKFNSLTKLVLESKEDMKKRGIRSPDTADALALTFALPETAFYDTKAKVYNQMGKMLTGTTNKIDRLKKAAYGR
jgi:hypothetical protein